MSAEVLLASDLDRTLLPNGEQPESPRARPLLRAFAARPEVTLAYVSGRHAALIRQALAEYEVPEPDYAIGDVGTTIYAVSAGRWSPWPAWDEAIAPDWRGLDRAALAALFEDLAVLRLQEPEKQNTHKLSYYAPAGGDHAGLVAEMTRRLEARGVRASVVWSIDETRGQGLIDVLPASASKLHAIRFLTERRGFNPERTVFAGDSGNDLAVLTSEVQAVLVANATDEVRRAALDGARRNGTGPALYLARGGFMGMNGNYAAGVLEGLAHFVRETAGWLQAAEVAGPG
ncbi:MAG: HAD-IIB family hydrolase [Gammaproteobacteria bacterium]|nr:HAD-IIB family hydrolase [Gammaproteobacteria bacterium]NIR58764.1 HAD-IIB family hydrolase [Gammaproteobacteria bacterium]NIV73796.1 HAD-IIB family hydrolase [Gammaproteobacteria bacterium]